MSDPHYFEEFAQIDVVSDGSGGSLTVVRPANAPLVAFVARTTHDAITLMARHCAEIVDLTRAEEDSCRR